MRRAPDRLWKSPLAGLGLILAISTLIRVLFLLELERAPEIHGPRLDGLYHHYWASALVTGDWTPPEGEADPRIRTLSYFRPPGYPWFLALVYTAAGSPSSLAMRISQMILGLGSIFLTCRLGTRIQGAAAGLAAAALLAGIWTPLYFEGRWLETAPLTFLLLLTLEFAQQITHHPSSLRYAGAGLALGLAGWFRPNAYL
ncbi:MAG: glycosyltransferase family 39 protein, partial [Kiritimatiellia bacterium]|nr:glycosyltransferase family 39 protein [Kiritimatiellia bacterium]